MKINCLFLKTLFISVSGIGLAARFNESKIREKPDLAIADPVFIFGIFFELYCVFDHDKK